MSEFISTKVHHVVLRALSPGNAEKFPENLREIDDLRLSESETVKNGFLKLCRCLDDPVQAILHDRIAMFGTTQWSDSHLRALNLQAFCLREGSFEELYCDTTAVDDSDCHYYRLDLHPTALGLMFKEPMPHLHVYPNHEPRIPFHANHSTTLIPDFISFLFRNYAYDEWASWVKKIWGQNNDYGPLDDPFPAVENAFQDSQQILLLNHLAPPLQKLKTLIHTETERVSEIFRPLPSTYDNFNL